MKVLYFCEGFTDIRFVVGLSEICELTMAVPEKLTPRRDPEAMAEAILRVARHPDEARRRALAGRESVCRSWRREKAFADLRVAL